MTNKRYALYMEVEDAIADLEFAKNANLQMAISYEKA